VNFAAFGLADKLERKSHKRNFIGIVTPESHPPRVCDNSKIKSLVHPPVVVVLADRSQPDCLPAGVCDYIRFADNPRN
jgi:hypothetical protein